MRGSVADGEVSDDALFHGTLLSSRRELVRALYTSEALTVRDSSGRATGTLSEMAGLSDSSNVTGLLKEMDRAGWIEREIRGKRTFAITLIPDNPVVQRLIGFFEENSDTDYEEEELPEPKLVPFEGEVEAFPPDTSIVDAANVADELLARVVNILRTPTSEEVQKRLGEQTEYTKVLRAKCEKQEKEIESLKTTVAAKEARIAGLNREVSTLESNLRAALKQERATMGKGFRALERFMQERPKVNN